MDKDKLESMDGYLEHIMRLSRVFYMSITKAEEEGVATTEEQEAIKKLAMAYCMLYEKHTGIPVWDLNNTDFEGDLAMISDLVKEAEAEGKENV